MGLFPSSNATLEYTSTHKMVRDNNSILGMDVQSISWLHGTMQCEVKSRCTAPSSRSRLRGALLFAPEGDSHMEVSNVLLPGAMGDSTRLLTVYGVYGVISVDSHLICHVQHINLQGTSLSVGCRSNSPRVPTESVLVVQSPSKALCSLSRSDGLIWRQTSAQTASGILNCTAWKKRMAFPW